MNDTLPPKDLLRQSFEKAADTYDSAAKVQRKVCTQLINYLPPALTPAVILDAGCGTGFAQEILALRFPAAHRIVMDFSPAMLSHVGKMEFGIVGDVEHIPLKNEAVGLYWSSLTAQWCAPDILAREAWRILWPSGTLALSSLGIGTFSELTECFTQIDDYQHTIPFQTTEQWEKILTQTGFQNVRVRVEPYVAHWKDLKSMLRAIKSIGANQIGPGRRVGLMGKKTWEKLEALYEKRRTPQGLPLTYQIIFCSGKRPTPPEI